MNRWIVFTHRFAADTTGVTMIEYGLLAALIAAVCVLAITTLGGNLGAAYTQVCQVMSTAVGGAGC